ncbi:MAG: DUF3987 domain-containing protein [Bacteroidales bacterium]|nr:DUF3987 domain-containing protein [Bacteroidales bacterium]
MQPEAATRFRQEREDQFIMPLSVEHLSDEFHPDIYKYLPSVLSRACELFEDPKEKDIILLGALTVISGCLPNICGIYDRRTVFPHLFVFVEAPAGSGKGVLQWTRKLAEEIHRELRDVSKQSRKDYESDLREWTASQKKKGQSRDDDPPSEPIDQMLLIPANNSASSFVQTLTENKGQGILYCTEADTLVNSLSQDWGNYSDVLRCAFHHEPISLQRRTKREFLELEQPRVAVLLTGTKGQLFKLIPDTENGLFSRFAFYSFPAVPFFRDVFRDTGHTAETVFSELGRLIYDYRNRLLIPDLMIEWQLSKSDQEDFRDYFTKTMKVLYDEIGEQSLATIKRLGLILFRIAMVLSTLRALEKNIKLEKIMTIVYNDYAMACEIVYCLIRHSVKLIAECRDGSNRIVQQKRLMMFYNALPNTFTRNEAGKIAGSMKISPATCGRYLISGLFKKAGHGQYEKVTSQNEQMSN